MFCFIKLTSGEEIFYGPNLTQCRISDNKILCILASFSGHFDRYHLNEHPFKGYKEHAMHFNRYQQMLKINMIRISVVWQCVTNYLYQPKLVMLLNDLILAMWM